MSELGEREIRAAAYFGGGILAIDVVFASAMALKMEPVVKGEKAIATEQATSAHAINECAEPGFGQFNFDSQEFGRMTVTCSMPAGSDKQQLH